MVRDCLQYELDQPTQLPQFFSAMSLDDSANGGWYMDSGATFHIHANEGIFNSFNSNCNIISVMVGDRSSINVTKTGSSILCTVDMYRTLHLHNILITPQIIKTLVYVRKFTKDNHCSIKFDAFGFSMKDFVTK